MAPQEYAVGKRRWVDILLAADGLREPVMEEIGLPKAWVINGQLSRIFNARFHEHAYPMRLKKLEHPEKEETWNGFPKQVREYLMKNASQINHDILFVLTEDARQQWFLYPVFMSDLLKSEMKLNDEERAIKKINPMMARMKRQAYWAIRNH